MIGADLVESHEKRGDDANRASLVGSPETTKSASGKPGPSEGPKGGLWDVFAQKIAECGVELFDMELPASRYGTLRIFITRPAGKVSESQTPAAAASSLSELSVDSVAAASDSIAASSNDDARSASAPEAEEAEDEIEAVLSSDIPSHEARVGGVIIEDCAKVSKFLQQFMDSVGGETLGLSGHDWNLEVSSPGINRALRRAEHFAGAIGERVRVRFTKSESVKVEICAPGEARSKPIQPKEVIRSPSKRGARPSPEALAKEAEKMSKKGIITGTLCAFEGGVLVVEDDRGILRASIPLHLVREARVDFLFS